MNRDDLDEALSHVPEGTAKVVHERDVEALLKRRVEERGGTCEKFTSPNRRSVPDRLVTWPWGDIDFVELKAPGKRPTEGQERDHARRRKMGQRVVVIDCSAGVEAYIKVRTPVTFKGAPVYWDIQPTYYQCDLE